MYLVLLGQPYSHFLKKEPWRRQPLTTQSDVQRSPDLRPLESLLVFSYRFKKCASACLGKHP